MDAIAGAVGRAGRQMDMAVALEVAGFRWVVWDRVALADAPLASPGRFLAHPGDLLAHLHLPASPEEPEAIGYLDRVPRFSEDLEAAVGAADAAGLFTSAGAVIRRDEDGSWVVEIPATREREESARLPEAICRASLRWARRRTTP